MPEQKRWQGVEDNTIPCGGKEKKSPCKNSTFRMGNKT